MQNSALEILYNGQCPICSAEIAHYKQYADDHLLDLNFIDLNTASLEDWGVSPMQARKRLHARRGTQIDSGLSAFIALWTEMPRYAWVGRFASRPWVRPIADWVYNRILAPTLYRMHLRRQARSASM